MMAGETGVALFPTREKIASSDKKIDHFAFRVDRVTFDQMILHYNSLGLDFDIQDHHYFHSVYTHDPDGNQVELTCLVREDFF